MSDYIVFDLETQRSADEVGGWRNVADMKVSVGVLWDSRTEEYSVYLEEQVKEMIQHLLSGPRVIGYNHIGFDYTVLSGYFRPGEKRDQMLKRFREHKNLDLLIDLRERLGHRLKLDSVAQATLKVGKSADGLMALKWYKQWIETGDFSFMDQIISYCKQDVEVTKLVYEYGIKNGLVEYTNKFGELKSVEVDWSEAPQKEPEPEQLGF